MKRPTITVCVTTYNQRDLIEKCLRSILDQEVDADIEVLVGDDSSTDGTSEVIEGLVSEFGARLQHFRHSPNVGPLMNMCNLVSRASGEFIARVDGDDFWLPEKLKRQLEYLQSHQGCSAVFTNAITVNEVGDQLGLFNDVEDVRFDIRSLLRRGNVLNNSSILFRNKYKGEWTDVKDLIDFELHLRLAQGGWIGHIGEPLAAYRVNTVGSMVATSNDLVRELYWQAIQSVPRELVSDDDYAHGIADFMRRVFYRAMRIRSLRLLLKWSKQVYSTSPYGTLRMTILIAKNILRMAAKILLSSAFSSGRHKAVLYRH